jgi:Cof subfamily protein (haloacid dehalogenase superfamily)
MYKLFCTDMDGTLLNNDGKVSEENKMAIEKAQDRGVKIAICTGRLFTSANHFAQIVGVEAPLICANGAYIREKDRNEIIYKAVLGEQNCKNVLKVVRKYGLHPHFNTPDTVFTEKIIYSSEIYAKMNKTLPKEAQIKIELADDWEKTFKENADEILKCIIVDNDIEKINKAKSELALEKGLEVVSSRENNIEVMCKGVSKGRAVEILAGYYNLKKEEVICIGDNENDISMLQYAGMGIAMANGDKEVLQIAYYITDTNENNGVAKAIEKFILI